MSLQLANMFLSLVFLCLRMGAAENAVPVFMVNVTPPSLTAMEGSEFTIKCTLKTSNKSIKLFAEWYKIKTNVTEKVCNGTDGIILSADKEKLSVSLTVKKADITDSGTYLCRVESKHGVHSQETSQVTVNEITNLMVNQTPASFSDFEGSEFTMACTFKTINDHSSMYVQWYNYGTGGLKSELVDNSNVITTRHLDKGFTSLTLKNANSSNTGTYVCEVGTTARNLSGNGTGTQVTIEKMPKLMVNQTPANIQTLEGSDLTLECRFPVWKKHNTLYVKWYKHNGNGRTKKELMREGGWGSAAQDLEEGFASFTLKNVNVTDTGTYTCEVGSRARNCSASGAGTQVTITPHNQTSYIVPGAVAGTLLFLLVLGMLLWRCKRCSKEPLQSRSEAEMNQLEPSSPSPADDVTYADLNFQKKNAKAEEEVVYTEVKIQPKQRDDSDIYAKVKPRHR